MYNLKKVKRVWLCLTKLTETSWKLESQPMTEKLVYYYKCLAKLIIKVDEKCKMIEK